MLSMSEELIKLCLKEFDSYDEAIKASPCHTDIITYAVSTPIIESEYSVDITVTKRVLKIAVQSSNGRYIWMPQDPGDFDAIKAIKASCVGYMALFGTHDVMLSNERVDSDHKEYLKKSARKARKDLMAKLLEKIDTSKIYQFKFTEEEKPSEYFRHTCTTIKLFYREV